MMRFLLKLAIILCTLLLFVVLLPQLAHTQASSTTNIVITPSKIKPNDPYSVTVEVNGEPYRNGELDYELHVCDLSFTQCTTARDKWSGSTNSEGVVEISGNNNWPSGVYLVRLKPYGAPDTSYSNYDILLVDHLDTINTSVSYTSSSVALPPLGSYMLFEATDRDGNFAGYARIDVETDPCALGGRTLRFTKTRNNAYWNAGSDTFLRWCITETSTPNGSFLIGLGELIYSGPSTSIAAMPNPITVDYTNTGLADAATQGILGGFPPDVLPIVNEYQRDLDMYAHYALLPPDFRIPANLSDTPQSIVEIAYGHPLHSAENGEQGLDIWHMEALEPGIPNANLRMRYLESGVILVPTFLLRWSVVEDWVWKQDGIISQITQWVGDGELCWRGTYRCTTPDTKTVELNLIDHYVPDNAAFSAEFRNPLNNQVSTSMTILQGQAYELLVTKADGTPYSGFLELKPTDVGNGCSLSDPFLWWDVNNRPIYVSNGSVKVGPDAYGNLKGSCMSFQIRPYLVNSSINSLEPVVSPGANASTAAFSNTLTLTVRDRVSASYLPVLTVPLQVDTRLTSVVK